MGEAFAAVRLRIDSPRWEGVPFFIRAGKCLPTTMTEVLVMLKRPGLSTLCMGRANYVRFRLSPDVLIAIGARVRRPGEDLIGDPTELKVVNWPPGMKWTPTSGSGETPWQARAASSRLRREWMPLRESFSPFWDW
jgi:glucose-6-phosphate 1-dehydrogenase